MGIKKSTLQPIAVKAMTPKYMREFQCIGPKCEETCCKDWNVVIDKPTYEKYHQFSDQDLLSIVETSVQKNSDNIGDIDYSVIKLNPDGNCPFMANDGLCLIQKKYGSLYLSSTCNLYPRVLCKVNSIVEISGVVSCPEMARLVLGNKESMVFEYYELKDILDGTVMYTNIETNSHKGTWKYYILELRKTSLNIIQERSLSMVDRLFLLGLFCQKVQECIDKSQVELIPELIVKYEKISKTGGAANLSNTVEKNILLQYELLKEMYDIRLCNGVANPENQLENVLNYEKIFNDYYYPFMLEHEFILENYLANYIFRSVFPNSDYVETVFDSYAFMIIHYAMIKFFLIAIAATNKGIDEKTAIETIFNFSRMIEHSSGYLTNVFQLLKEKNFVSLAYMTILIKN